MELPLCGKAIAVDWLLPEHIEILGKGIFQIGVDDVPLVQWFR